MTNRTRLNLIAALKEMGAINIKITESGDVEVQFAPDIGVALPEQVKPVKVSDPTFDTAPTLEELFYSA